MSMISVRMTSLVYKRLEPLLSVVAGDGSGDDKSRLQFLACLREHAGNGNQSEEYYSEDNLVDENWVPIKGVIFDMDGTLTKPVLNFSEMRQQVGVPPSQDILQYVNSLSGEDKVKAMTVIEEIEEDAINKVELQPGVIELLHFLAENKVKRAMMTRNSKYSADVVLKKLQDCLRGSCGMFPSLSPEEIVSQVVSREFQPHKPDPSPVYHICTQWSLSPHQILLVGDGQEDMISGHRAGTVTALIINEARGNASIFHPTPDTPCDVTITSLSELLDILQRPLTIYKRTQ